jgi:hypothetical protein
MQSLKQEPQTEGLRIASNIRFVFTKKNRESRVTEIKKTKDESKRGRRVTRSMDVEEETPTDIKKTKSEWGRAFKHMNEGKEPAFDIFLQISQTGECGTDPFYRKIFREMAYGTFPKGMFYDKHRDCLVCTEVNGKRKSSLRKSKVEKFMQICTPNRICKAFEMELGNRSMETRDTEMEMGEDNDMEMRALKCIYRSSQRLELPVEILYTKYGMSYDQIYQEIKLFFYSTSDLLSPWDANLLQNENFRCIQTRGEEKQSKSWKKLSQLEQVSHLCQYCRGEFYKLFGKPVDMLNAHQTKIFTRTKNYLCNLLIIGVIPPSAVVFEGGCVNQIHGVTITPGGVSVHEDVLEEYREKKSSDQEIKIGGVIIQKLKNVDLQKISNGIDKQMIKATRMIRVITESDIQEE